MEMPGRHSYRPRDGHRLPHDPFNAIVAPRPIGWIGSRSAGGVANLAPYSFFNALAYHPPTIGFASDGEKDSLTNARETGLFSWNLVTRRLAERMNATSAAVAPQVDEFALANLACIDGPETGVPIVAESPAIFECRVSDIHRLRTAAGEAMPNWVVIGEVVAIHLDPAVLKDGVFDTAAARPVMRGGGPTAYFEASAATRFDLRRPG
jgi:flavin reductase (DIM6/NTAB) family NADH-FMN oxidoreductase RutF